MEGINSKKDTLKVCTKLTDAEMMDDGIVCKKVGNYFDEKSTDKEILENIKKKKFKIEN